jgi:outer membrane protein OmpA-like peptidoglycan-associated protein
MRSRMKEIVVLILFLGFGIQTFGQDINVSKVQSKAEKLFQYRNYNEAQVLYLELEKAGAEIEDLDYKIAKCLKESKKVNDRVLSVTYFERIDISLLKNLPYNFYMDFGDAYSDNEQIEQALGMYNKHLELVKNDRKSVGIIEQKIAQGKNAYSIMRIPKNVVIENLGEGINSEYTEYNPVLSADESILAFTALRPTKSKTGENVAEEINISYNITGSWSVPEKIDIKTDNNYGTAGISADGQKMLVFIGDQSSGSIYQIEKEGDIWGSPKPLGKNVQSKYLESTASMTPDGKTIYFASNRPGGYGGLDIYKSDMGADGTWGKARNLGSVVNSKDNEDSPYIHPNKSLLFFTTDGHNGMGGNDIYKTELNIEKWLKPKNMGYPINTTANDNYFTLIADGSRGYFSSDRKGGFGGQDIYSMDMPEDYETIPLTMIKGRILDADSKKPLSTEIYMVDINTKEKIDYVYHPNKQTGDYLVILPPNKSYDMIIKSEGFLPYTLNIDVPNQKEFYELYQKIYLKTIKHFDVVVGQEVQVNNVFYKTHEEGVENIRKNHEAALLEHDSIDAFSLMSDLIEAGDQEGIDYLLELLLIENPIDDVDFETNNESVQSAKRVYYYDESDESKFEKKQVGDDFIYSLPTMFVTKEALEQKTSAKNATEEIDEKLLSNVLKIYFDAGRSEFDKKYESELNTILDDLKKYENMGIEIAGYASSDGDEMLNEKLSNQRAISVLDYINHRGIVRRRIIAKGFGSVENEGVSKEESRRVEVRIIDLNKL